MSMNLESELRMRLKAMTYDMQSPNPLKSLDEKKAIIERYVQDLLDMLQESYGQVPELGKREGEGERESYSRWHQLFSTPERAARTLIAVRKECEEIGTCYPNCPFDDAPACPSNIEPRDYDALLEWLNQDVDA